MMKISIAERLRPFSHSPGTRYPLPGSALCLEIFPTRLRVLDLSETFPKKLVEITLGIQGPVKEFTGQLDLERGVVRLWGHYQEGFVRLVIHALKENKGFAIRVEKCPENGLALSCVNRRLAAKKVIYLSPEGKMIEPAPLYVPPSTGRLSLGSHQAQDWDLVRRRSDLKEIFPVWYRLGHILPEVSYTKEGGTADLLHQCSQKEKRDVVANFLKLFWAGTEGIMVPRWEDTQYQGLVTKPLTKGFTGSPLAILSEGAVLAQSLFINCRDEGIDLLPTLPPEFHCGRLIDVKIPQWGVFSIEWTKKSIRRMIFHAETSGKLPLFFQKDIKQYRLRHSLSEKGQIFDVDAPLNIEKGKIYLFDRFTK